MENRHSADPIQYFDETLKSPKHHRLNPHAMSSKETLAIMKKHFMSIGLTRTINLTGLDRIGLPVFNAVRPGMANYSVQHGKGRTEDDARLSAVMEAFERFYGSNARLPAFRATWDEAAGEHRMVPFERIPKAKNSVYHRSMAIDWTVGFDIIGKEPVAVPLELALLLPRTGTRRLPMFQSSSNGLASATNMAEAVCQGLLEVIERDAITCDYFRSRAAGWHLPLDLVQWQSVDHPVLQKFLATIRAAGILPMVFSCGTDTRVPTFNCYLADLENPSEGMFHGMGAGMDDATAMIRAVTEAVQARLALRAGTRDAFFHQDALYHNLSDTTRVIDHYGGDDAGRPMGRMTDLATATFEGDVQTLVRLLKDIGIDQAIVIRLTPADLDFVVVRVIVPGLEGYMLPLYAPGTRALAFGEGRAA